MPLAKSYSSLSNSEPAEPEKQEGGAIAPPPSNLVDISMKVPSDTNAPPLFSRIFDLPPPLKLIYQLTQVKDHFGSNKKD